MEGRDLSIQIKIDGEWVEFGKAVSEDIEILHESEEVKISRKMSLERKLVICGTGSIHSFTIDELVTPKLLSFKGQFHGLGPRNQNIGKKGRNRRTWD